jgi:hypothetical protein
MSDASGIEQWLFTFESATGRVCRVEKRDPASGAMHELSQAEYAALDSYLTAVVSESEPAQTGDPAQAMRVIATQRAYVRGMADCAALYRQYGLSR